MDKHQLTAEERLLRALFGAEDLEPILCCACGEEVVDPIYFNGLPYHSACLDHERL